MLKENAITAKYNTKVNQCGLLTRRVDLCIKRLLFLARSKASVHVGAGKLGGRIKHFNIHGRRVGRAAQLPHTDKDCWVGLTVL